MTKTKESRIRHHLGRTIIGNKIVPVKWTINTKSGKVMRRYHMNESCDWKLVK